MRDLKAVGLETKIRQKVLGQGPPDAANLPLCTLKYSKTISCQFSIYTVSLR